MSLFYTSNATVCESNILLFRTAVVKYFYLLQQIYCDYQK